MKNRKAELLLRFFNSNQQIQNHLNCCESTATKSLNNLEKIGLIYKEYQARGLPLKIYVNDIRENNIQKPKPKTQETSFDIDRAINREKLQGKLLRIKKINAEQKVQRFKKLLITFFHKFINIT